MRRDLARKHLDKRLSQWQPTSEFACPPRGWIRAIREAIGIGFCTEHFRPMKSLRGFITG